MMFLKSILDSFLNNPSLDPTVYASKSYQLASYNTKHTLAEIVSMWKVS